jgi:hypothetical protein
MPAPRPAVVATIGMHGSASTWVFNVARELVMAAVTEACVATGYADTLDQLPPEAEREGRHLVLKSHHGSVELDAWLTARRAVTLLSLRDPRDACISMMQRFRSPLQTTARWIANDCNRLLRLVRPGDRVLRYEDRFFEQPAAVTWVAERLGLKVDEPTRRAIFDRYRTEAVRDFAARLETLPPARLTQVTSFTMDRVTQILAPHIGDGQSGKWRALPAPARAELSRFYRPFLERFGYPV